MNKDVFHVVFLNADAYAVDNSHENVNVHACLATQMTTRVK
jgi:hypothetical protein